MYRSGKPIGFWSAVLLGMGAMIGAGIFALMGQAGAVAGSAVWLSFVCGGVVATLSGYSFGRLGARFPSAGGLVEYLVRCWGDGFIAGTGAFVLYLSGLLALTLIAKAFGSYTCAVLLGTSPPGLANIFGLAIVFSLTLLNLRGSRDVAAFENLVVAIKAGVLFAFVAICAPYIVGERLAPATYPDAFRIAASVGFTFFAFEGFRVITNAAEDMPDPARMLPRAMMVSIGLVGLLYVLMSLTVFGNLDVQEVVDAKDYALARAASPVLGKTGFLIVGIAAMISTASAINANLYAVTNVSYRMATSGELPASFGRPVAHSRAGLVISAAIVAALTPMLNLTSLAVIGSLTILVVHVIVHVGHLRVLAQTGASGVLVGLAMLANGGVIAAVLAFEFRDSPSSLPRLLAFVSAAAILELIFRHMRSRRITRRDREPTGVAAHHGSTSGDV